MTKEEVIIKTFTIGPPRLFVDRDNEIVKDIVELIAKYDNIIVCVEGKHYKFWTYRVTRQGVLYHWGRIGTNGQEKEIPGDSRWDAESKMRSKLDNHEKGYVTIGWTKG
jgi:predicted DNA-binding WGR domain protein